MNYWNALKYLNSFLNFERIPFEYRRQFNLQRMRSLLHWFDFPQNSFRSVLIAGTKGKGSTANFLSHVLSANGYKAGLYTSPHLMDPRERIRVNGKVISKPDFARIVSHIQTVIHRKEKQIKSIEPITYFEIFTLIAILYFAERKVDLGIFEVGMGGRLDATNVLQPLISIITSMSYDHQEHLGSTLKAITAEKAAIIKKNGIVVVANQKPEARQVIQQEIRKQKAKGYFLGKQFKTSNEKITAQGGTFDFKSSTVIVRARSARSNLRPGLSASNRRDSSGRISPNFGELRRPNDLLAMTRVHIPLTGGFQIKNAALALKAADILKNYHGFKLGEERIRRGLKDSFWPGRFEQLKWRGRTVVLDGAHNGASMEGLCLTLKRLYPKKPVSFIFGTSREKQLTDQLKSLLSISSSIILTKSTNPRAQEPKVILEAVYALKYGHPSFLTSHLKEAFQTASRMVPKEAVLVVAGSLFLIGEAREILKCPKFI